MQWNLIWDKYPKGIFTLINGWKHIHSLNQRFSWWCLGDFDIWWTNHSEWMPIISQFLFLMIPQSPVVVENSVLARRWGSKHETFKKKFKISPNWLSQKPQKFNLKKLFMLHVLQNVGVYVEMCVCVCPVCVQAEQRLWE